MFLLKCQQKFAEIDGKKYNPVAYVAEGGKITAKDTKAYGYGSVIAYAKNQTRWNYY